MDSLPGQVVWEYPEYHTEGDTARQEEETTKNMDSLPGQVVCEYPEYHTEGDTARQKEQGSAVARPVLLQYNIQYI